LTGCDVARGAMEYRGLAQENSDEFLSCLSDNGMGISS
jgi:hypothetical protein